MIAAKLQTVKQQFFDRKTVTNAVDATSRRVLSRFGAFVRQTARNSIRTKKGASRPGQPPHSHVGLLKKLIFFAYDPSARSVVIGPTLLTVSSVVPKILEFGGEVRVNNRRKTQVFRYKPRPYMGPAFERERAKIDPLWANSIRG